MIKTQHGLKHGWGNAALRRATWRMEADCSHASRWHEPIGIKMTSKVVIHGLLIRLWHAQRL